MGDGVIHLFASGRAADIVLVVLSVETAVLVLVARRGSHRPSPLDFVVAALPGAALVVALRLALTDAHETAIATALVLAFLAHVVDVWRRIRAHRK